MTIREFKEHVKTRKLLDTEEIHQFMDIMSNEARRITFQLNTTYHTPNEVRELLSELFGYRVPSSFRVFPPFYTDFGKNITIGEDVFINACCHFQDHGGITIGDGCQIGHNVVFATLNHGLLPEERKSTQTRPNRTRQERVGRLQCHHSSRSKHREQCHCRSGSSSNQRCPV